VYCTIFTTYRNSLSLFLYANDTTELIDKNGDLKLYANDVKLYSVIVGTV